jgi:xylitol oxidase
LFSAGRGCLRGFAPAFSERASGPWHERLPHFKIGFTPNAGKELQSEYFVPRRNAVDAILAVERLRDQVTPHLLI